MIDYKNFFNQEDPLNIWKPISDFTDNMRNTLKISNTKKNEDEELVKPVLKLNTEVFTKNRDNEEDLLLLRNRRLELEEQQRRLEELKRLQKQETTQLLQQTEKNTKLKNFFENEALKQLLISDLQRLNPTDLLIYDSKNNYVIPARLFDQYTKALEELMASYKKDYDVSSKGIEIIGKIFSKENISNDEVYKILEDNKDYLKEYIDVGDADFETVWKNSDNYSKIDALYNIVLAYALSSEELEALNGLTYYDRLGFISGKLKYNPFYQSLTLKHKLERADKIKPITDKCIDILEYTDFAIPSYYIPGLHLIVKGTNQTLRLAVFGGAGKLVNWGWGLVDGSSEDEDVDAYINSKEEDFIGKFSDIIYQKIKNGQTEKQAIEEFDKISRNSSDYMSEYLGRNDTLWDKLMWDKYNISDEEKVKQYAKYIARELFYGLGSGVQGVSNFWQNHIDEVEDNTVLGYLDKHLKTTGTFWATGAADIAAFAGVLYGLKNVDSYNESLVTDNALLRWASDVLETGCILPKNQQLYKSYNANALKIHRSTEEENSAGADWDDAFDIVGLYGFTAATTLLSCGGSAAAKGLSAVAKTGTKAAFKMGLKPRKTIVRALMNLGLASTLAVAEKRAMIEAVWAAQLNTLKYGNLTWSSLLGTAEGALEAQGTYDQFIKDNAQDSKFNQLLAKIEEAEGAELELLMELFGMPHSGITKTADGGAKAFYTLEDYANAKEYLKQQVEDARVAANNAVLERAVNAATANFWANSAINGILMVTLKHALLSKDAREAIRLTRGNKLEDLVSVYKQGNLWVATVNKAIVDTNKRNVFKAFHASKKIAKAAVKESAGEFGEEYGQNISDTVSRDIFQSDLDNYLKIVFNPEARDNFESNVASMIDVGLQSLAAEATEAENLKAGAIGMFSSLVGGFSPVKLVDRISNFKGREDKYKGKWGSTLYWIEAGWDNAYAQSYREEDEKYKAAESVAEKINDWFSSDASKDVLKHIEGSLGFSKAILDAIIAEDLNSTKDNQFGLMVETVSMIRALANTEYGKAIQQKIDERANFNKKYTDADFDEQGNYIGNDEAVNSAINTFRNSDFIMERASAMSDKLIIERVQKNALEFKALLNEVEVNAKRLNSVFNTEELDPMVQKALIYGFLVLNNVAKRLPALLEKLNKAANSLSEEDKKQLLKSGLSSNTINLIRLFGSIALAEKYLETLNEQIKEQSEIAEYRQGAQESTAKYSKDEIKKAKQSRKSLNRYKNSLIRNLKAALTEVKNLQDREVEDITSEVYTDRFTAGDIANMSAEERSEVISNKEDYSQEQQEEINKYISLMHRGMKTSEKDLLITEKEVELDLIDEGILTEKLRTYDKYVSDYISNARFLNTRASQLYALDRKRVLKRKYAKDLEVQEEESPIDYLSRLEAKALVLADNGKMQDAQIFKLLIRENPTAKRVEELRGDIHKLLFIHGLANKALVGDKKSSISDDINLGAALKTLILNGNRNIKELKEAFKGEDLEKLLNLLRTVDSEGNSFFIKNRDEEINTYTELFAKRTKDNPDATPEIIDHLDIADDNDLIPIIQTIKDLLANFEDTPNSEKSDKSNLVFNGETPSREGSGHKENIDNPSSPKNGEKPSKSTKETINVITPGALDKDSLAELRDFLESKKTSITLDTTSNKDLKGKVRLAVTKEYKGSDNTSEHPVIFVISADAKPKVLGVIKIEDMPEIKEAAIEVFNKTGNDTEMHTIPIKTSDGTLEVQLYNDGTYMHDTLPTDSRLIILQTHTGKDSTALQAAVEDAAREIIDNAEIKEILVDEHDPKEGTTKVLESKGMRVKKVNRYKETSAGEHVELEEYLTIWTYPIMVGNQAYTLGQILGMEDGDIQEALAKQGLSAIDILKKDLFFRTLFEKWETYNTEKDGELKSSQDIFHQLINDFIFVGDESKLNPTISASSSNPYMHITGTDGSHITIYIPSASNMSTEVADNLAFDMLKTLYTYTHIQEGQESAILEKSIPNISFRALAMAKKYPNSDFRHQIVEQEAAKLAGLMMAGYIETSGKGYLYMKNFTIKNPYYKRGSSSTESTDSNASMPDNPGTGKPKGKQEKPETKIGKTVEEAIKKAKQIVERIHTISRSIILPNNNAPRYTDKDTGKSLFRVTSLESGFRGLGPNKPKKFTGSKAVSDISTTYGNINDNIGREFFEYFDFDDSDSVRKSEIENNYKGKTVQEKTEYMAKIILQRFKASGVYNTDGTVPNMNSDYFKAVVKQFVYLHLALELDGWHVTSKDLKLKGRTTVYENGVPVGKVPVGGALDLLAYNNEGDFIVIDMKTVRYAYGDDLDTTLNLRKSGWTALTNSYSGMLQQENPDINIIGVYIFPTLIEYDLPEEGVKIDFEEDGVTFKDQDAFGLLSEPTSAGEVKTKADEKAPSLDKLLVKLETKEWTGIDIEDFTPEELEELRKEIEVNSIEADNTPPPSKEGDKNGINKPTPSPRNKHLHLRERAKGKKSKRTKKEARFTEFINNYIAPIKNVKIGVIAKTITKIGEWFTKKENINEILQRDLANAFFDGDVEHLKLILKGVDINNISAVIKAISNYYKSYTDRRELYLNNIGRRQRLNKALYDFFSGNISRHQLNRLLDNLGLKAREVPALLDYLEASNKEEEAKKALAKLELKKEYKIEHAKARILEMTTLMDNMLAKLEFLQSPQAERMLEERLQSVKEAILSGSYRESKVHSTRISPTKMAITSGTHGSRGLLKSVIRHSSNPYFKQLAKTILTYVELNNLVINTSIGDKLIDLVEGETKERTISISKDSMDTFEHFERVFLHEMLHAVVELSPELKSQLEDLRKQAIFSIVQLYNITENEALKRFYGLTDVDEFITEFFTNYAFLDTLKLLSEDLYDNVFDSMIGKIKNHFTKDSSLYGRITDSMNTVMESINVETIKREEVEIASQESDSFSNLSTELLNSIKDKGFTEATYNELNFLERMQLRHCCI